MFDRRESGILLPVFSLPGPYGIGTLGREARRFVDFLCAGGQRYWQMLPLVPPGEGNSPYMSPSSFAGNPLLIDLEGLLEDGLLTRGELDAVCVDAPDRVDYDFLHKTRLPLLKKAFSRARKADFFETPPGWLLPYARFMALREAHGPLQSWPDPHTEPDGEAVRFHLFLQAVFFRQWFSLKAYAGSRGVSIIGDLPFYVSPDSAEVWQTPSLFQLDAARRPAAVAGVPPDAFSQMGQLWGNPLYAWEENGEAVFAWWAARMDWASQLYDVVRIDHFRAFHTYWSVPVTAQSALEGHWRQGPGMALVGHLQKSVPGLRLIAEDLGELDEAALAFIRQSGLPGMNVLLYAFDPAGESAYLPHSALPHSVMYTGTHDTPTFVQWLFDEADDASRDFALSYLRLRGDEGFGWGAVCGAWACPCRLAIAPMQDLLGLGADARLNTPGTVGPHNWSWRVRERALNDEVAARLRAITRTYRRCD